ncbi:MAG: polymer-forming cytoskeletal protein [Flavisolibacter sp.]|jgi:cytoskeletal protein CcmA (bactofilin family)|nr:polymer-forming cytoskeletal protein [Flavisolibacter sp.]
MFKKEKDSFTPGVGTSATLISPGTVLKGDIISENDIRIDGTIHGDVNSSSKIIVGPSGFVTGNINGKHADIHGKVSGNIAVEEALQLRAECNVTGNLKAANLQVDPNAVFNGQCQMGTSTNNVVLMSTGDEQVAEAN